MEKELHSCDLARKYQGRTYKARRAVMTHDQPSSWVGDQIGI